MQPVIDKAALLLHIGNWSRGPGPLYLRLAEALQSTIERGDLPPMTRLPAERSLAGSLAISRGTVMAAYERLRELDLVDSRHGSGTWVRLDAARAVSVLNDESLRGARARPASARLFDDRRGVVDLATCAPVGMGGIRRELLMPPDTDVLERLADGHGYQPLGLSGLRCSLARHFGQGGLRTEPEQVAITTGAQQAISLVVALTIKPGDVVVVETPTYPGALDAFSRAGARIVSVPAERAWVSTSVLRDAITRHAARMVYLMPACHNPLGRVMSESRRREIARLADEHEVFVIEDNTLAGTTFEPDGIPPLAAFGSRDRVLTVGSLSKVGWAGLRVGWVRGPRGFIDRLGRLKAAADYGGPALSQLVAQRVLEELPAISAWRVAELRRQLDTAQNELRRRLPAWTWTAPQGGSSLWLRLPDADGDEFAQVALRHGVDVTPGSAFAADDSFRGFVSVGYARSDEVLRDGVDRLASAWCAYRGDRSGPSSQAV